MSCDLSTLRSPAVISILVMPPVRSKPSLERVARLAESVRPAAGVRERLRTAPLQKSGLLQLDSHEPNDVHRLHHGARPQLADWPVPTPGDLKRRCSADRPRRSISNCKHSASPAPGAPPRQDQMAAEAGIHPEDQGGGSCSSLGRSLRAAILNNSW
jgi:hypothetical protein